MTQNVENSTELVAGTTSSYKIVTSPTYTCPGGAGFAVPGTQSIQFQPGEGTVVSVGFQNIGMATDIYATQIFVVDADTVYVQVANVALTSTDWCIWCVVDTSSAPSDYSINTSEKFTCPAHGSVYQNYLIDQGPMASVGVQNIDNAIQLAMTQMFVNNPNSAYIQVTNNAFTSTDYLVWSVVNTQKTYSLVMSPIYTCSGGAALLSPGTQSQSFSPPGGGTVVSVGVQNYGNATALQTSQAFVVNSETVFVQVANFALTSTNWSIWCVVDTTD